VNAITSSWALRRKQYWYWLKIKTFQMNGPRPRTAGNRGQELQKPDEAVMVFPQLPRYDMGVSQETPPRNAVSTHPSAPMVPMSAEDFARAKRRVVFKWLGVGLVVILLGIGIYERSRTSQDGRKALNDGEQMLKAGRYTEAIQSFDRALTAESGLVNAYLLRGRANASLNQPEAAIRDFTKVIQLQPSNADAFVERAAVHLGANDYPAVLADCGEALSRNPKLTYAYNLRGMAYRALGNLPKSLEDFNRAVELAPALDTYFQRATTYQSMSEHAKAIADLDQVIALFPTSPMGYLARAKSREALGDAAGARTDREAGRRLEDRPPDQ
jgi:tetratricopeptide (TPR) repeat protein